MPPLLPCMGTDPVSIHLKGQNVQNYIKRPLHTSKGSGSWSPHGFVRAAVGSPFLRALVQSYCTPGIHRCCKSKVSPGPQGEPGARTQQCGIKGAELFGGGGGLPEPGVGIPEGGMASGTAPDLLNYRSGKQRKCLLDSEVFPQSSSADVGLCSSLVRVH